MSNVPITRKLTTKQTALVDTIVANGCTIAKAAELAGYSSGESGRVTATKTMKLPHVQQYLMQRMNEEFGLCYLFSWDGEKASHGRQVRVRSARGEQGFTGPSWVQADRQVTGTGSW